MPDTFKPFPSSPLEGLPSAAGGISLTECPDIGKLNVRGNAGDSQFLRGIKTVLGVDLPKAPNTVTLKNATTIFWMGPDEWLIHSPQTEPEPLIRQLRQEFTSQHVALTDVSDYYVVLRLSGARTREVLSKGTPFDLNPGVFQPGDCAQTRFGHAGVLLHCVDSNSTIDIQVRWSFAEYLWLFLVESASEYVTEDEQNQP